MHIILHILRISNVRTCYVFTIFIIAVLNKLLSEARRYLKEIFMYKTAINYGSEASLSYLPTQILAVNLLRPRFPIDCSRGVTKIDFTGGFIAMSEGNWSTRNNYSDSTASYPITYGFSAIERILCVLGKFIEGFLLEFSFSLLGSRVQSVSVYMPTVCLSVRPTTF